MPHPGFPVTLLALALPIMGPSDRVPPARVGVARLTIRERIVIRVPRMPPARLAAPTLVKWKERKGPRCVAAAGMAGALISARNQVDLVMVGGKRLRVKLDGDCKPLDYYGGFYLRPASDGMICADRDAIRVRSGASCEIEQFRSLQPAD